MMWSLAITVYALLKWWSWRHRRVTSTPRWRHIGYLLAWPGMNVDAFLDARCLCEKPRYAEWAFAVAKMVFGLGFVVMKLEFVPPLALGWCRMIGMVFLLHFGAFHVLSCMWRSTGVCAPPIMCWPILSMSVAEFWGRRWNLAFRDLAHQFVFRRLSPRVGASLALFAGFVISGLIHDLVITVPAGGGWGGPTVYFMIQGAAVLLEHSRVGTTLKLGRGLLGWLFTATVLIAPVSLLFPRKFVCGVIVPFFG